MADMGAGIPAIVVARQQTAIGTLRALHLAGIRAFVACPANDPVRSSRWFRPVPGAAGWDGTPGAAADAALAATPLARAVVIPGRDDAVPWAADLADGPLGGRFLTSSSSRAALEILLDKSRFGAFLAGTGIPHPRTFVIRSDADIAGVPFADLDRVFVKPANSQRFLRVMGAKGLWAHDRAEFEAIWRRAAQHGLAVIAQEYIPGGADDHYFIDGFRDRSGALTGLFARRRIRIYPPDFGNSSYCVSVPMREVDAAVPGLTELLQRLDYRGIFSTEFKRDARDGKFRILEVNTRAWWYVEFAARCGVNVVDMAWRDAQGLPMPRAPADYVVGAGCVHLPNELQTMRRRRGAARTPIGTALRQWRGSYFSVFRWDDPLPGLQFAGGMLKTWLRKHLRRPRAAPPAPQS